MGYESIAHEAEGRMGSASWAIDSEPMRARGIIEGLHAKGCM